MTMSAAPTWLIQIQLSNGRVLQTSTKRKYLRQKDVETCIQQLLGNHQYQWDGGTLPMLTINGAEGAARVIIQLKQLTM